MIQADELSTNVNPKTSVCVNKNGKDGNYFNRG